MVLNASSTPSGSLKFSSLTSTSVTLAPNECSALDTPRPVASDTSRSEPGPPISTAMFLPSRMIMPQLDWGAELRDFPQHADSCVFSHDLDFGFQLDPALF